MKILRQTNLKSGRVKITVEMLPGEKLAAFNSGGYYITGYPMEEIVRGSTILDATPVAWCEIEQRWIP